jgi:hypothetical protein
MCKTEPNGCELERNAERDGDQKPSAPRRGAPIVLEVGLLRACGRRQQAQRRSHHPELRTKLGTGNFENGSGDNGNDEGKISERQTVRSTRNPEPCQVTIQAVGLF